MNPPKISQRDKKNILNSKVLTILFFIILAHVLPATSFAQLTGAKAELVRLRDKAEEAISMGDPQGAALNTGKAALMAALMAKQGTHPDSQARFQSLEAMLRAQESVYRAIALFQQSGEQIPASSGVCRSISLASTHQKNARTLSPSSPSEDPLFQNLLHELQEWKETIEELQTEFGCSEPPQR